jgi:hypothetical protein
VQIGTGEKNSLSSEFEEESKERDLHRVVEHPADSAIGCLSRRLARRASKFSICRRRKKDKIP